MQHKKSFKTSSYFRAGITGLSMFMGVSVAHAGTTSIASLSETDEPVQATEQKISADGHYVVFASYDTNVISNDTNYKTDIFVRNLQTNETTRVSIASDGTEGNGESSYASISTTGRYITFMSTASNLVPNDSNNASDVFLHDRETGVTERISVASDGAEANQSSYSSDVSADGRYIVFSSHASNLVANDTNDSVDAFIHDRTTGETKRFSVSNNGTEAQYGGTYPQISSNGRFVSFASSSNDLVPGDTNEERADNDIFVYNVEAETVERVSISTTGEQAIDGCQNHDISADGRYVTFSCHARNLVTPYLPHSSSHVYLRDRENNTTEHVGLANDGSIPNSSSSAPTISEDGRYIAFTSHATNLVAGDTNGIRDVFVRDRVNNTTQLVNVATDGTQANSVTYGPLSISRDGEKVVFRSLASTLGEGSGFRVFLHNRQSSCN